MLFIKQDFPLLSEFLFNTMLSNFDIWYKFFWLDDFRKWLKISMLLCRFTAQSLWNLNLGLISLFLCLSVILFVSSDVRPYWPRSLQYPTTVQSRVMWLKTQPYWEPRLESRDPVSTNGSTVIWWLQYKSSHFLIWCGGGWVEGGGVVWQSGGGRSFKENYTGEIEFIEGLFCFQYKYFLKYFFFFSLFLIFLINKRIIRL